MEYWSGQILGCVIIALLGLFLYWRYQVTVARKAQIQAFQYRLFAVRDQVIFLVASEKVSEDDHHWIQLYEHVNNSADWIRVEKMRHGLRFVLRFLRSLSTPSDEMIQEIKRTPKPILEVWEKYAISVVTICYQGSWVLRLCLYLASKLQLIASVIRHKLPKESSSYTYWNKLAHGSI